MPIQSPKTCEYCKKRPADQTLFTTFMRCGEGDATKRNAHLCDQCRHQTMLVLDHVGMTISFEGDDQLRWDAHIRLSDQATRSRARRTMQREDMLLQFRNPPSPNRAREPSLPEKLSLLHQLHAEGLVESTIDRGGEFWPEDTCTLTTNGQKAATFIDERRHAEADGLPIGEWSPLYVPEQGTEDEFREYADQCMVSPAGDRYDSTMHLMLRRKDGAPAGRRERAPQTNLLFDEEMWTSRPTQPVGYFFFRNVPAIAFDIEDAQMLAEYYELIRTAAGPDIRWTVMDPTPMNPTHPEGTAGRTIRADGPVIKAAAFVSTFMPPGERPGIRTLRQHAQQQHRNGEAARRR